MDGQTTLSQYFTARKNDISIQPSKRRKLDTTFEPNNGNGATLSIKSPESKGVKKHNGRNHITTLKLKGNSRTPFKSNPRLKISDSLKSSTKSIPKSNDIKKINDHYSPQIQDNLKNKVPTTEKVQINVPEFLAKPVTSKTDELISDNKIDIKYSQPNGIIKDENFVKSNLATGELQKNSVLNEQAKTVLFAKGSALIKGELLKSSNATFHIKQIPSSLSVTPDSNSPIATISSVDKKNLEYQTNLRSKYAHLLHVGKNIDNSSPVCRTSKDSLTSNEIKEKVNPPAHLKYKHLLHKSAPESFKLPHKYKIILEMFRCVDSVLYLLNQRKEVCTFDKLKKSVQSMSGREFSLKHLASIKTVYPTGYIFRQEVLHKSMPVDYHLTVEANFKDVTSSNTITPSVLITRRLKFENSLVNVTKVHHQKFLQQLNLNVESKDIHRWHPDFKVDDVPDIELSLLPQPPILKCYSSATDILSKNGKDLSCKVEKALENVARNTQQSVKEESHEKPVLISGQNKSRANLKGVSNELLERIRMKEQKKIELALTCDPAAYKRLALMEKLPEMARILKAFFTAEKKAAITLEDCLQKLSESYTTAIPSSECEDLVRLLAELVPSWISIVSVRKCPYIKLARNFDLNNIMNVLLSAKKEQCNKAF